MRHLWLATTAGVALLAGACSEATTNVYDDGREIGATVAPPTVGEDAGDDLGADATTGDVSSPAGGLVINEVDPSGDPGDWFELYNGTAEAIDLTGYTFADDASPPGRAPFEDGLVIQPGEHLQIFVTDETVGFKLGSDEACGVFAPDGSVVDATDWDEGAAPDGGSWGRSPDGTGPFRSLSLETPAAPNVAE